MNIHCLRKKRHHIYICDNLVRHPILPIIGRNIPQGIWNKTHRHITPHLNFICLYLYLVKTSNDFHGINTASNIRDTALHCLRPVATKYTPDLNPVDYSLPVWGITRSASTTGPYSTSLIWSGTGLLHGLSCSSVLSMRQMTSNVDAGTAVRLVWDWELMGDTWNICFDHMNSLFM